MADNISEKGMKIRNTMLKNNSRLYVFESKKGERWAVDGLRVFARLIHVDPSNLYRTYVMRERNYHIRGWKLIGVFDLLKPDWDEIGRKTRKANMSDRVSAKLDAVENGILELKRYGRQAWSILKLAKRKYSKYAEAKKEEIRQEKLTLRQKFNFSYSF